MTEPDAPTPEEASAPPTQPPAAPPRPLPRPPRRTGSPLLMAGALAALLAVGSAVVLMSLSPGEQDAPEAVTQAPLPTGPAVTLKLFVEHEEAAMELPSNVILGVGETVMFELGAAEETAVRVWVETDGVRTADLGTFQAGPEAGLLADGDALVAYGLGKPGTVVFRASSSDKGCGGESCASVVVTVRDD